MTISFFSNIDDVKAVGRIPSNSLANADCLEAMKYIEPKSIGMILCDLPYGTISCEWDSVIPFKPLWMFYKRLIKDNGAIVLTASQPFSSALVLSNINQFKYEWIWAKNRPTGFINAKNAPLKKHESVLVFSRGSIANCSDKNMPYFPQGLEKSGKFKQSKKDAGDFVGVRPSRNNDGYVQENTGFPDSLLFFPCETGTQHPTQKPLALFEYLIKTYSVEGETVLDNCCGSGTTAVASLNTHRKFICIEKEPGYFEISKRRILGV